MLDDFIFYSKFHDYIILNNTLFSNITLHNPEIFISSDT